ncbi:MAG: phosphate/phosphite/phosphonate ABC transporter substrate-binding protein [Elusimicrobia bacterium]|nr:phosphate/phosphite/phosphonate ABC transporter substrate-binding protein [Elusimicrobiota bacterium]
MRHAALCLALFALFSAQAAEPRPRLDLRFGRIPFINARDMISSHENLMRYLTKKLGLEVRLVLTPDYDALTRYMKEGKIDVGWFGTLNYPKAREETGCTAILKTRRFGAASYRGMIITRADSGIKTLKGLKGHSFAFTEPSSASGYFYPRMTLLSAGIDPDKDLKAQCIKGHDKVVYNVFLGKYDAGAVYDDAREKLSSPRQRKSVVVLARTKEIVSEPIAVRKGLDGRLVRKLKAALLALDVKRPQDKDIIGPTGNVQRFVEAADADYDSVREDLRLYESLLKR